MDIKLIAMDLDGTALMADKKNFSPRLLAALEAAYDRGIAIVPVTGRQYGLLPPALQGHPRWSGLCVLCNGGQIRELESGRLLWGLNIPEAALRQLHDLAARLDLPLEFSVDSRLYLTRRSYEQELPLENLHFHVHTILKGSGVTVESLEALFSQPIEKALLPHIPEERKQEVEAALKEMDLSAVWASSSSMEITHPDATKGNALHRLSRLLDIPREAMLAIGDSGNDISMLRAAGTGIAMGNAPEEVKQAAVGITDTNTNDGAAKAIEKYVLQPSL